MASLFNDPAIDSIVRYSAGGSTSQTPAQKLQAGMDALWSTFQRRQEAELNAGNVREIQGADFEGVQGAKQIIREYQSGDGMAQQVLSGPELDKYYADMSLLATPFNWAEAARSVAQQAGYDPKVVPANSNPAMYGAMRAQAQSHSDPARMLMISGLEPTKGNIGMAEVYYNNPNATRKDLEEGFKQATKGGGALRQVLGDDIMNALPAVLAIAGNIVLPGLGTGVGAAFGAGAGSALNGASGNDIVKAMALTYGGANLGAVAKDLAGTAVKTATAGMDLGAGATKALTQATTGILRDAGTAVLTGKPIDIGKSLVNSGIGLAGGAADSAVTDFGGKIAGDAAGVVTTTALRGGNVNNALTNFATNTMVNTGVDAIKNTDTYKDMTSGLQDALTIDGFSMPGSFDLTGNIVPGLSAKDATALVGALPGGKQITNAVSVVKNPTVGGIKNLVNNTTRKATTRPPTVRTTTTPKAPPTAVLSALNKTSTVANPATVTTPAPPPQPPAAVLAALQTNKNG